MYHIEKWNDDTLGWENVQSFFVGVVAQMIFEEEYAEKNGHRLIHTLAETYA